MPSLVEATFVCTFCFIISTETKISANARISGDMRTHLKWPALLPVFTSFLFTCLSAPTIMAQTPEVFRLDGGRSTYAFGVNERGELQTLYWGAALGPRDKIPLAHWIPKPEFSPAPPASKTARSSPFFLNRSLPRNGLFLPPVIC